MSFPVDKSVLESWRNNSTTVRVWANIRSLYRPYENLRTCDPEKVEYYRCMADMMEELGKIFQQDVYED